MAANSRESRRRKILERGSERLAFIKGHLSSSSEPQLHEGSKTESSQSLISREPHLRNKTTDLPDDENKGNSALSGSMLLKEDPVFDADHTASAQYNGSSEESLLPEQGTSIENLQAPASEVNGVVQSSILSSTEGSASVSTLKEEQQLELQRCQSRLSTSQISSAISATGHARLFCSVGVALLVVLSYLGFPLQGSSIIRFSPLYLVLLTNLTIVLSRLLHDNQGGFQRSIRGENNIPSADAYDLAEQASKALEVGLLMQKVIDAIFIDCSVYSIIVICGFCFI